jgi:hypothetical protein
MNAADAFDRRVARRLGMYRAWCRSNRIDITPGGEVAEDVATQIVGYHGTDTLAVQRSEGRLSPLLRMRRHGRGYLYDLRSCALFVETGYDAMLDEHLSREARNPEVHPAAEALAINARTTTGG